MSDLGDIDGIAPKSFGAGVLLRQAREARRLSVDDIAQTLKLTPRQVAAIESEEFDLLPGKTFARGFVRNYARLLQLDPAPLLDAVETRLAGAEVDLRPLSNAAGTMPAGHPNRGVPRSLLAGLALAVVALGVGVYLERFGPAVGTWQGARPPDHPPVPNVAATQGADRIELPPSTPLSGAAVQGEASPGPAPVLSPLDAPTLPVASEIPSVQGQPPATAKPASAEEGLQANAPAVSQPLRRLSFRFGKEAWVEVRDGSGKLLTSRLNAPGSVLDVEGQGPFALVVGNAASVELRLDDRVVDLKPHTSVSVARMRLE